LVRTGELSAQGLPFVTLPTFDVQASLVRASISSPLVVWSPLLATASQLHSWNAYTTNTISNMTVTAGRESPVVFNELLNPIPATRVPSAPIWQVNPSAEKLVNFNLYSVSGLEQVGTRVTIAKGTFGFVNL
jgi:hypothetical protein